jgi:carbamoyl-phosphate synthase small subunit
VTPAVLALETGRVFRGRAFGAPGETMGEVVFCTAMTGYQEILTDPSYQRQIVVMTYPHIGNYGIQPGLDESSRPHVAGFVARDFCRTPSHWNSRETLQAYLERHGVVALDGVDTRALTRHLREQGACRGVIATGEGDPQALVKRAQASPSMTGADLVKEVTCSAPWHWAAGSDVPFQGTNGKTPTAGTRRVALMDFGVKWNIARSLAARGCDVTVLPATASSDAILALAPDGVMLSNGPGDPAAVTYAVETLRRLIVHDEKAAHPLPLFGICLGHQLLGLALGGKTFKLKFGHRGANHPVKDLTTGKVEITTQNHGFAVDMESLPKGEVELTHVNLNDGTLEGLRHKKLPIFSVQHHPEAFPGPHDAHYLFDRFLNLMRASSLPAVSR